MYIVRRIRRLRTSSETFQSIVILDERDYIMRSFLFIFFLPDFIRRVRDVLGMTRRLLKHIHILVCRNFI